MIADEMPRLHITKNEMAKCMHTSRARIDRVLVSEMESTPSRIAGDQINLNGRHGHVISLERYGWKDMDNGKIWTGHKNIAIPSPTKDFPPCPLCPPHNSSRFVLRVG